MTREHAKELLPIIQAYADGKTIQLFISGEWENLHETDFSQQPSKYRIKPEPRYRPFANAKEFEPHRDRWVRYKNGSSCYRVIIYNDSEMTISGTGYKTYKNAFKEFTFNNGEPFGIKESE